MLYIVQKAAVQNKNGRFTPTQARKWKQMALSERVAVGCESLMDDALPNLTRETWD